MKSSGNNWLRRLIVLLMTWMLLAVPAVRSARAEDTALKPEELVYENGNIILSKHAERISADEWRVTIKATIGEVPVEKRKMEVVFVLDCSGSMAWCTDEADHELGSHTHRSSCYTTTSEPVCGLGNHTHTFPACYGAECTRSSNPDHWAGIFGYYWHRSGYGCEEIGGKYYPLECDLHTHTDNCYKSFTCERDECNHSNSGATPCTYIDENGNEVEYKTRLQAAKDTISSMVANLTEDGGENIIFKYVIFSSANRNYDNGVNKPSNQSTMVVSSFNNVTAEGGTYMYTGIQTGLNQFSDNDYKKVLVVLTDGDANDSASIVSSQLAAFKDPAGTDGTVFTVGFAYSNDTLANIAGNGGTYVHAGSDIELNQAMQGIETSLTAMLHDPMGSAVGFDKTSIEEVQTSGGVISTTDDTIYWHPAQDGSDTVRNSTIEYSYVVKLNQEASMTSGVHSNIPLNNPTSFLYGIKSGDGTVTEMKEVQFPIPHASYSVSTLQTMWKADGQDIQPPTDVESVVCDFASASSIPVFTQDYRTITPVIPIEGSHDYYRYIGTTVTADSTVLPGVDAIDATQPVGYTVVHEYERVNANELVLNGTKTIIGRDFMPGDTFTFDLVALTANAPMPESSTVTISPSEGPETMFTFGSMAFTQAGVYEYTLSERDGQLDGVVYDTATRTLVVTAEEIDNQIVVSYTLDGVHNGQLAIANHLRTGSLCVTKNTVQSHLPQHQELGFGFLISVKDLSGRPLNGQYPVRFSDGSAQTLNFNNGYATVTLKAGQSAVIDGLPDGATFTVTEDVPSGFTVTSTGSEGAISADLQTDAVFDNVYQSTGLYQLIGVKVLENAEMTLDRFSFTMWDEDGNVAAHGKNNTDGSIFFDTLTFTQDDIGTHTYTVREDVGTEPGIVYDRKIYTIDLTITDPGNGTLVVTDNLNGSAMTFTNTYIDNQFTVAKMVEGTIGSKHQTFDFTITLPDMLEQNLYMSTDGGETFHSATLDAQGRASFTLCHDQVVIFYPVTGRYTVTETNPGDYTTTYTINQAQPVAGTTASGTADASGCLVTFVNTLDAITPTGVDTPSAAAWAGLVLALALLALRCMERRLSRFE